MVWFWGSQQSTDTTDPIAMSSTDPNPIGSDHINIDAQMPSHPLFALDQLKASGVPLKLQMTPYLQMDPSVFANNTPQIIMPEGYEQGRGKFEVALSFIGAGVGGAYVTGCFRGFFSELLFNPETMKLPLRPMSTRLLNATTKYGSGYAQTVGSIAFIYSFFQFCIRGVRGGADDFYNGIGAGALTGGLYRMPHGLKQSAAGVVAGIGLSAILGLARDDYDRIDSVIQKTRLMFKT